MSRPNIVLVYCDDLGIGDLGCYGADDLETPNIDELARNGVQFSSWYSNAPVCSPARAALLTGRHPDSAGMAGNAGEVPGCYPEESGSQGLPPAVPIMPEIFGNEGYRTGISGKWHLGVRPEERPEARGFDDSFGFLTGCVDYFSHLFYYKQGDGHDPVHDLWENGEEVWRDGEYMTHMITERACEFVREQREDPFFLYVPYSAPHYPMHAPAEYFERFEHLPEDRRATAAMIAAVDEGVGEIVSELRRTDQFEETIVFFCSDHGPSRETRNHVDGSDEPFFGGSTGGRRGHKFTLFEGGIRVPAILHYPEAFDGSLCEEPVMTMDLLPTLLELCDVEPGEPLDTDGESLLPMLRSGAGGPHDALYWKRFDQLAIRRGEWKLVVGADGAGAGLSVDADDVHLSDLEADPAEETNLVDERPEIARELEADLRSWATDIGR